MQYLYNWITRLWLELKYRMLLLYLISWIKLLLYIIMAYPRLNLSNISITRLLKIMSCGAFKKVMVRMALYNYSYKYITQCVIPFQFKSMTQLKQMIINIMAILGKNKVTSTLYNQYSVIESFLMYKIYRKVYK